LPDTVDEACFNACQSNELLHSPWLRLYNQNATELSGAAMVSARTALLLLLALCLVGTALHAQEINWQEAVTRLARERTLAETCAALLKRYGDPAAQARGAATYGEAKADYDGVIAGLVVALARKEQPKTLPDLQARLQRGFEERDAFCRSVQPLLPPSAGQKGPIADIVEGAVKPVIDALVAIWSRTRDDDALMRKTIQTQLEATSWPSFDKVAPSP
jgi:hypothetical protein